MAERRPRPDGSDIVAGIALLLCGLCLLLVGGGCTTLWISELFPWRAGADMFGLAMLVLSMAVAALGFAACYKGVRLMMPKRD
jgi:hypothetical protein